MLSKEDREVNLERTKKETICMFINNNDINLIDEIACIPT